MHMHHLQTGVSDVRVCMYVYVCVRVCVACLCVCVSVCLLPECLCVCVSVRVHACVCGKHMHTQIYQHSCASYEYTRTSAIFVLKGGTRRVP